MVNGVLILVFAKDKVGRGAGDTFHRGKLFRDEEGILKNGVTEESAAAFAAYAAEKIPTGSNVRGSAAYRTHLIKVLTERSVRKLGGI